MAMDRMTAEGRESARQDYCTALEKNKDYLPARVNLALLLQAEGRFMAAWNMSGVEEEKEEREGQGRKGGEGEKQRRRKGGERREGVGEEDRERKAEKRNTQEKKRSGKVDEEKEVQKTTELSAAALAARGVISLQMGHLSGAMLDFSRAIRDAPQAETLTNRGVLHQFLGDLPGAMRDYQRAVNFDPSYCHAHYNIGNVLFSQRQFREACKSFSRALGGSLDDAVLVNRGLVHMMLGEEEEAMVDITTAIELNPAAHAFFNRGHLWRSRGQLELARDDYTRGMSL